MLPATNQWVLGDTIEALKKKDVLNPHFAPVPELMTLSPEIHSARILVYIKLVDLAVGQFYLRGLSGRCIETEHFRGTRDVAQDLRHRPFVVFKIAYAYHWRFAGCSFFRKNSYSDAVTDDYILSNHQASIDSVLIVQLEINVCACPVSSCSSDAIIAKSPKSWIRIFQQAASSSTMRFEVERPRGQQEGSVTV
nr:hypothetical protein CFP56_13125 [Quercus suber]